MISKQFFELFVKKFTKLDVNQIEILEILWKNGYELFDIDFGKMSFLNIVSRLIVDKLPWKTGSKYVIPASGEMLVLLVDRFSSTSNRFIPADYIIHSTRNDSTLIISEIEKINQILEDESKVLGV